MNRTIYLVRHCEAGGQQADAPLTVTGERQAIALADRLCKLPIERIISSPFVRACRSIEPFAERQSLAIETDERLVERVLSSAPMADWCERLEATFLDLDLSFDGGESSRAAMTRGVAVVDDALTQSTKPTVLVTHGNLMTLILKHFDEQVGFAVWENLQNPDLYCVRIADNGTRVDRLV